ncbi:MAG TPA: hypothetical protein DEB10_13250 [Ruminococcaceae bacterium]|jgi:hypothetical protein|nr:hypothetical protein [Oscillospiraceae bacterium]
MNYEYHITAFGKNSEEEIVEQLSGIGMSDISIEKLLDISSFIKAQDDATAENLKSKWKHVSDMSILPKNGLSELIYSKIDAMPHKSIKSLAEEFYRCCVQLDMSDHMTGLYLQKIINEIKK